MKQTVSSVHWTTSSFLKSQKRVIRKDTSRWVSKDGDRFYEWDSLHGEIEVFNRRGKHIAVLNSDGSASAKEPVAGRSIDV
jgi:hypothetical protein